MKEFEMFCDVPVNAMTDHEMALSRSIAYR